MKITSTVAAAVAMLTPFVSAQYAIVRNNCTFPSYVQSFPQNGAPAGPLTTLAPGAVFAEPYQASGSTVKMGTQQALAHPLFFGYSFSSQYPNQVYYELNNRYGNPFVNYFVDLGAAPGCASFDCAPNAANCYSTTPGQRVYSCTRPTNTTAVLCARS